MREVFTNNLKALAEQLSTMANRVTDAITQAGTSLRENNLELAESVISNDEEIDTYQLKIDQLAANLLATQQPVAEDLRTVISALRISSSLERMGDLARHISQQVRIRYPDQPVPSGFENLFDQMLSTAASMSQMVEELLQDPSVDRLPTLADHDEVLDTLHLNVFTKIAGSTLRAEQIADVTLISRYLERFGDHAVSIAERMEYLLTGSWTPSVSVGTIDQ